MMNIMNPPADWSTLKKLIWLRGTPITGGEELTVSGTPPLSLPNSLGKPLKAWEVALSPYQEGSGDPSPDNVRAIHGTDKLTIYTDSKYGGLVEWNQTMRDITDSSNFGANGGSIQYLDGRIVFTPTTGYAARNFGQNTSVSSVSVTGHKYYYYAIVNRKIAINTFTVAPRIGQLITIPNVEADTDTVIDGIFTATDDRALRFFFYPYGTASVDLTDQDTCSILHPMICDLTEMFGAGNEPSTVEEFRALFPNDYYPYNAGQQMTVDQVNGAQYSPAVLTLPQTVYTGTIGSEGGESRWGEVDLGDLNWGDSYNSINGLRYASISDIKPPTVSAERRTGFMCEAYKPAASIGLNDQFSDMAMCRYQHLILIRNTSLSFDDFKTSVQGTKLIYELSTPSTFALTSATIPTPTGTATTWATAEDGTVDGMEVTYVGEA